VVLWLVIVAGAVGGGLVILHGFSQGKAGGDHALEAYQDLLEQAARHKARCQEGTAD
jgi:hypothetical protein